MRYWDSNSRPLGQESPPLTTRPGLPLINMSHFISILIFICLLHYAMEICSLEQVPNWWHMCEDKNCLNGILNYAKLLTSQITISSRNYFSLFLLLPFLSLSLSLSLSRPLNNFLSVCILYSCYSSNDDAYLYYID